MDAMVTRILIADDHSVVRQGLRMFLALDPELEVVAEATGGGEAEQTTRTGRQQRRDDRDDAGEKHSGATWCLDPHPACAVRGAYRYGSAPPSNRGGIRGGCSRLGKISRAVAPSKVAVIL